MRGPESRARLGIAAVALFGLLALAQHLFDAARPPGAERRVAGEIIVTSGADRGEGSLREALFAAATAPGRTRIVVRTPAIALKSALPPLVNPAGTVIEGQGERVEIDASAAGKAPVLDITSAQSHVSGISIVGAPGPAILVRAADFRLHDAGIARSAVAVHATQAAQGLTIERARLVDNGIGVRIEAPARGMAVRDSQFSGHREAAVWMVLPESAPVDETRRVLIFGNRFDGDRIGVVAGNLSALVERNELIGARETALHVVGRGVALRGNQVRGGAGIGVLLHDAPRVLVEQNDISGQKSLGMLVRASGGATVHRNRIHANAYGMAFVLGAAGSPVMVSENTVLTQRFDGIVVIGDSPVVRRNDTLNNGHAGLRVLDFQPASGSVVRSAPFLEENRTSGNGQGEVVRGLYRAAAQAPER